MAKVRNILLLMADQLRWDYLSCYGHPSLKTPNLDRLAARGVRFDRAYCQAPVCGPSRMSIYTGRTSASHGGTWNFVPLPVGEMTIGDYLRPHGIRTALVGKTHHYPDAAGMERLGISRGTEIGLFVQECGFEPFEHDDGEHPNKKVSPTLPYNAYLRALGYDSTNPWNDWANGAEGPDGEPLDGWLLRNSKYPSRLPEEHTETAYMTNRALDFLKEQGDDPWCLHLSYIKPHWPYIAPAPYHDMYGPEDFIPVVKDEAERTDPNPVFQAFMNHTAGQAFGRDEVRATVLTAYMGLIKQIDDHIGRVLDFLEETGRMDDTLIVFTSDHGDYMGDHWLGEKELFHEPSVRVPLIVYDPAADATRGSAYANFIEQIDLLPTFLEALGLPAAPHRLEGRSLAPLLREGRSEGWRDDAFSELDYAFYKARLDLGVSPGEARCFMIRTERWKYVDFVGFPPMLFDLANDPDELVDLGRDPAHDSVRREMRDRIFHRLATRRNRVGMTDEEVVRRTDGARGVGVIIGEW